MEPEYSPQFCKKEIPLLLHKLQTHQFTGYDI